MLDGANQRVRADKTPNPRYHDHEGFIVRYVSDMDGTLFAEVVWDQPFPVETMARQIMDVQFLTSLDENPLGYLMQELP